MQKLRAPNFSGGGPSRGHRPPAIRHKGGQGARRGEGAAAAGAALDDGEVAGDVGEGGRLGGEEARAHGGRHQQAEGGRRGPLRRGQSGIDAGLVAVGGHEEG